MFNLQRDLIKMQTQVIFYETQTITILLLMTYTMYKLGPISTFYNT